ncbi:MAG: alpha/beta hydrolase [Rhodospirillaceae bacterium]|nr:alpha/beta hydrolase [Rhodospirillaceae bacterium]MBT5241257.1 alpha/beta hydrolase [Rhodospirillaceae bacterium]MBT5565108.1 alpha/beta hydrolase [Rhodospirillaceae bacterium]MBT6088130.1 alpha/beta hydrolase [Rhodospirillaceae bacterium]MBT6961640.1 alpha/beta hydrolase [Rhodospirillaceae bacterium]
MTRRDLFASAAATVFAANTGAGAAAAVSKKTYILVHGAWHGGWCWRYVKEALEAAGHTVLTPSLTGLGDRVHLRNPGVNLTTHVTDIVNLFEFEDLNDVILVGHSYAGHVVSWVADKAKDRIKHVVYLDAVLPTDGKAFLPPGVGEARVADAKDGYLMAKSGMDFLGIPEGHPLYDWVDSRLVEHPLPTLMETVVYENDGPAGLPKTFVRCTQNPRMASGDADPVAAMTEADSEWAYITLDTGHDLMVTAPDETADILLGIG